MSSGCCPTWDNSPPVFHAETGIRVDSKTSTASYANWRITATSACAPEARTLQRYRHQTCSARLSGAFRLPEQISPTGSAKSRRVREAELPDSLRTFRATRSTAAESLPRNEAAARRRRLHSETSATRILSRSSRIANPIKLAPKMSNSHLLRASRDIDRP